MTMQDIFDMDASELEGLSEGEIQVAFDAYCDNQYCDTDDCPEGHERVRVPEWDGSE